MPTIKSPDNILLATTSGLMRFLYRHFGISPLAIQFYPVVSVVCLLVATTVYMSVTIDLRYLIFALLLGYWAKFHWNRNQKLRADSKKEWSAELFRIYGAKASVLRETTVWVRTGLFVLSFFITWLAAALHASGSADLVWWQDAIFVLGPWSVFFMGCSQSCELPHPNDGDFFTAPSKA